jgi:hypothetical protein
MYVELDGLNANFANYESLANDLLGLPKELVRATIEAATGL